MRMLKDLTDAIGVSGNERDAREVMRKYIEPYVDHVETDNLGSLVAVKKGRVDGPKIMIAGHLDEVGFMVTQIDENGYLRFQTIGGWWSQVMLAQRVVVQTSDHGEVPGVIGSKPPHILSLEARKKAANMEDMFIDVGAEDRAEAEAFGIRPGDSIVLAPQFTVMKNEKYLVNKAWDNRIGCALAIDVLKNLQGVDHPNVVYGVGTVQEEVGSRGAKTSARLIGPDIGIAVDAGVAGDVPGISEKDAMGKCGKGPQIVMYEATLISHKGLRDFVTGLADEMGIPFQYDVIKGGFTDGGAIHLTAAGVPALTLSVPTRYLHTGASMLNTDDYVQAVRLVTELVKRLDAKTVHEITYA
ncbi:MAG TPA: M42 family metallopeptidase [Bacillales bacterium]|nr:M42 family metallopeptidase [Bacillales bacterium]